MFFWGKAMEDIVSRENSRLAHPETNRKRFEKLLDPLVPVKLQIPQIVRFRVDIPCYEKLPFWWRRGQAGRDRQLKLFPGRPGKLRMLFKRFQAHVLRLEVRIVDGLPRSHVGLDPADGLEHERKDAAARP